MLKLFELYLPNTICIISLTCPKTENVNELVVFNNVISEKMRAVARVPPMRHRERASIGANQPVTPSSKGECNAALPGRRGRRKRTRRARRVNRVNSGG